MGERKFGVSSKTIRGKDKTCHVQYAFDGLSKPDLSQSSTPNKDFRRMDDDHLTPRQEMGYR